MSVKQYSPESLKSALSILIDLPLRIDNPDNRIEITFNSYTTKYKSGVSKELMIIDHNRWMVFPSPQFGYLSNIRLQIY